MVKVISGEGTIKKSPLPQAWYWHEALPQVPDFGEDDIPKRHHRRFSWDFQQLVSFLKYIEWAKEGIFLSTS